MKYQQKICYKCKIPMTMKDVSKTAYSITEIHVCSICGFKDTFRETFELGAMGR